MKIDIPKIFKGQTVTIVGGGISLEGFDFSRVKGNVVAVNNACFFVESKVIVALDSGWHLTHGEYLRDYKGYLVTDRASNRKDVHTIEYHVGAKHENIYDWHMKKANLSGFVALGLTLYLGASKIFLLGFDGGFAGDKPNYYESGNILNNEGYSNKNINYEYFKDENIINVGHNSKIEAFKKISLYEY